MPKCIATVIITIWLYPNSIGTPTLDSVQFTATPTSTVLSNSSGKVIRIFGVIAVSALALLIVLATIAGAFFWHTVNKRKGKNDVKGT